MRFVFKILYKTTHIFLQGVSILQPNVNDFTFIHFTFYCMARNCGALFLY